MRFNNYIYDYLVSELWINVSKINNRIAAKRGFHENIKSKNFSQVFLISPQNYSNKLIGNNNAEKVYGGFDLTLALRKYVEENLNIKPINISLNDLIKAEVNSDSAVVTWIGTNPKSISTFFYFIKIVYVSMRLYRKKIPVITYLPDTWFPDAAIVASTLNVLTCGVSVVLQSSILESKYYGYPAVAKSVLWTFPPSRVTELYVHEYSEKTQSAVLSFSASGGSQRIPHVSSLEKLLVNKDMQCIRADGTMSETSYIESLRKAKIVVTTNFTQDGFYFGSKKYRSRISPRATTGMNWEAFAAKALLITNPTKGLEEQGFLVNIDYLDIEDFLNSKKVRVLSDEEIRRIAENGYDKFIRVAKNSYLYN